MKARGKRGTGSRCREAGNAASGQDRAGIRCGILLDVLVKPHDLTALQCKILLFALGKEILPGALAGKLQSCGLLCKGVIKLHVLKALGEAQEGLDDFACMRKLEQLSKQKIPAGLYALKDMPERFADVISCEEMEEYVIAGAREILK